MNRIDQLRQQIDACRAGSDDLYRPELAELAKAMCQGNSAGDPTAADPAVVREFDRAQRFDQCVVSALHDVAVPPGLLQKLLAQASQPSVGQDAELLDDAVTAAAQSDLPLSSDEAKVAATPSRPRMNRRQVLALVASGIVAASVLATVFAWWPVSPQRISGDDLAIDVGAWMTNVSPATTWQTTTPPPNVVAAYPVRDMRLGISAIARWRPFRTARGESGVVFDIPRGATTIRLFVISTPHTYSVRPLPLTTLRGTTGGWGVGAWQALGGPLYVLVVSPGERLHDYVNVANPA